MKGVVTIPAYYEEYDEDGTTLRKTRLKLTLYLGEKPPCFEVALPLSPTEMKLGIGKHFYINVTDLYNLGIHVPENFEVTPED